MKKIFFLVLSSLFIFSQLTAAQCLSGLGIKAGATLSNEKHKNNDLYDLYTEYKSGFNASVYADFINSKYFNITAETGYDQRGYVLALRVTDPLGNETEEEMHWGYRTDYIFTSIGAKLKYKGYALTPYLQVLPRIDFYLGYKVTLPNDTLEKYGPFVDPVLEQFKKIMFDIGFGAGLEFNRLLPYKVFIEANYNPGIINSFSNSYVKVKEHSFNFKLGINLIKDKKKSKK